MDIEETTDPIEDIEKPIEPPIEPPIDETITTKSKKVRTAKQIEALNQARIKCYAKRREKSELKAKQKQEDEAILHPSHDNVKEVEPVKVEDEPEDEPVAQIVERRDVRNELKKTLTMTEDELRDMMERVALKNRPPPVKKSKFKLVDGMFVLRT